MIDIDPAGIRRDAGWFEHMNELDASLAVVVLANARWCRFSNLTVTKGRSKCSGAFVAGPQASSYPNHPWTAMPANRISPASRLERKSLNAVAGSAPSTCDVCQAR